MDTASWAAFFQQLAKVPALVADALSWVDWIAFALAAVMPILVLYSRHEVRIRRLRQLQDFYNYFGPRKYGGNSFASNPTFEFVRSKYTSDLSISRKHRSEFENGDENDKLRILIEAAEKRRVSFGFRLFVSACGFIALSYVGFDFLIDSLTCGLGAVPGCFKTGQNVNTQNLLIIASLTFVGAYIASVRTLLNRLSLFDLSSNTFLRITGETFASVLITVVLYAALSATLFSDTGGSNAGTNSDSSIPLLWLALAVLLGLIPQSSTKFLLVKLQEKINWIKTTDDRFVEVTRITSPEVIDGVDYEMRFRLEECGIYDVQNLATYNPILMHIETPYSIYQCIDWIAQAQLCHIVGLERFLIFRELNVRTIFDLERAVDSIYSPDQFDDIYASVLFAPTERLKQTVDKASAVFLIIDTADGKPMAKQMAADEFCRWAREAISRDSALVSRSTEHLMCWITDDLHIRRLRRLWNDISASLGPDSEYFSDSKRKLRYIWPELLIDGGGI